ncbi:MAG: aspartate carbamoyltransferase regulatory subunit [Candidatus Micrarchaeota archaeon]
MQVDKIEMGTVVDHIRAGKAGKVMRLLHIGEDYPHRVAMMLNVPSKKMKTKDILKIEGKVVTEEAANMIALVSPGATVNIVKGGKLEKKFNVELPREISGLARCSNPNCITGEGAKTRFTKEGDERYRCHYCERLFKAEELV